VRLVEASERGSSTQAAFRYSLRVLQVAFHPYCSPNVKQE